MWRGPAFADLQVGGAGIGPFAGEALRLEELRLVAVEGRGEARLRTGRHHAVIADLAGTLAEHQFRERLAAQLMVALYRAGRQAEALELFHRVRIALADTMGVDPGDDLIAVYRAILSGSDDLYGTGFRWPRGSWRQAAGSTLAS
jgi:DNA-binding SARP family transcriptional activator